MCLDVMLIQKDLPLIELIKKGVLIIEPIRLFLKKGVKMIIYQTIGISLINKDQTNGKYLEKKRYVDKKSFDRVDTLDDITICFEWRQKSL
ncbi:hypothetical protein IHE45_02G052600 [Dioscorea alata]|uniref:Uncharacterized protein n=1 Tax=Dioscorea alata TaxID=55571 RepID=A0ACB7WQQ1_DIOAL|nr:hypothetical protein IHE45_02G052600 [Dioscorea alata]